jgi:hypothetical protein
MKAVMTRVACNMVMDKDTVATHKAFDRIAGCYDLAGRLVTKPTRRHTILAIDLFQIRPAQPARAHFDKNIPSASQVWYFDIIDRNRAGALYKDCFHLFYPPFLPNIIESVKNL